MYGCAGMVLIILCNGWGRCVWVHVPGYDSLGVVGVRSGCVLLCGYVMIRCVRCVVVVCDSYMFGCDCCLVLLCILLHVLSKSGYAMVLGMYDVVLGIVQIGCLYCIDGIVCLSLVCLVVLYRDYVTLFGCLG